MTTKLKPRGKFSLSMIKIMILYNEDTKHLNQLCQVMILHEHTMNKISSEKKKKFTCNDKFDYIFFQFNFTL